MTRFYLCEICGNLIEKVEDSGLPPSCCGQLMKPLKAESSDETSSEKHKPIITITNATCSNDVHPPMKKVQIAVGSKPHPSSDAHYIKWIQLQTETGSYRRYLEPGDPCNACFIISQDEKILLAYAYCNLHGLWRSEC